MGTTSAFAFKTQGNQVKTCIEVVDLYRGGNLYRVGKSKRVVLNLNLFPTVAITNYSFILNFITISITLDVLKLHKYVKMFVLLFRTLSRG